MKKRLLIYLISIALLSGVSVAYRIYCEINRNSLLLENIEALADSESTSIFCYNSIKIVDRNPITAWSSVKRPETL
ncbi:MAG: NVEALA domain-containing protein [Candidatus Cryptobacteroides sp.]